MGTIIKLRTIFCFDYIERDGTRSVKYFHTKFVNHLWVNDLKKMH